VASLGGRLLLAWTGTDGCLNPLSSRDGRTFGDKATLPFRSWQRQGDAPTHGESLVVAWRNMRNRVCVGLAVSLGNMGGCASVLPPRPTLPPSATSTGP
jgi:hypothetical protein